MKLKMHMVDGNLMSSEGVFVCLIPNQRNECRAGNTVSTSPKDPPGSAQSRSTFLLETISDDAREWTEAHPTRQLWDGVHDANTRRKVHSSTSMRCTRMNCHYSLFCATRAMLARKNLNGTQKWAKSKVHLTATVGKKTRVKQECMYQRDPIRAMRSMILLHGQTSTTNISTVNIIYLIPFISVCHTTNINIHSSWKDHRAFGGKQGISKIQGNPEQKFTITTSQPSLPIHLSVPKYSSRITEGMFFARRESW